MIPMQPWSQDGADDFERDLLAAGSRERPSAHARQRTLALLGAAAATTVGSTSAAAATGSALLVAKWVGVGLAAGLLTLGAGHGIQLLARPTPAARPAAVAPLAPAVVATAQPVPSIDPVLPRAATAAPDSVRTLSAPAPLASQAPVPAEDGDAFTRELALIDSARAALAGGDAARCSQLLEEHARLPQRALGPEAEILAIEADLARGQAASAAARARSFLARSPRSPHARLVASLLATAEGDRAIDPGASGNGAAKEAR